ncbi:hypothetical protein GMMP15_1120003 [Candidatus Magnetomoraceae bacterium gMMP-15]
MSRKCCKALPMGPVKAINNRNPSIELIMLRFTRISLFDIFQFKHTQ